MTIYPFVVPERISLVTHSAKPVSHHHSLLFLNSQEVSITLSWWKYLCVKLVLDSKVLLVAWPLVQLANYAQVAAEGRTSEALLSLLEVDRDISDRLMRMTEQEPELMETIKLAIDSVADLLIEEFNGSDQGWADQPVVRPKKSSGF